MLKRCPRSDQCQHDLVRTVDRSRQKLFVRKRFDSAKFCALDSNEDSKEEKIWDAPKRRLQRLGLTTLFRPTLWNDIENVKIDAGSDDTDSNKAGR